VKKNDLQAVKQALMSAGVEIYRTRPGEIQVAERIRLHIMDSGIRVQLDDAAHIVFTGRSQQTDFPHDADETHLARVRAALGVLAEGRGYTEIGCNATEVRDPSDESRLLDVWHEVSFSKGVSSIEEAVAEVTWALSVEKYVSA
jgi:hypothetical protein